MYSRNVLRDRLNVGLHWTHCTETVITLQCHPCAVDWAGGHSFGLFVPSVLSFLLFSPFVRLRGPRQTLLERPPRGAPMP